MGERLVTPLVGAAGPAVGSQWRCSRCRRLLAVLHGDRLHIRLARGHEYLVGFPATTACRHCKTLNEIEKGGVARATCSGGGV